MAIRYVKDFEFPAAAGYTKSATKVTGQMLAKGGPAKAPKGIMVMIGVGKPVKKAEGDSAKNYDDDGYDRQKLAQMSGDANAVTEAEKIMAGRSPVAAKKKVQARKPQGSPYIPGSNIPQTMVRTPEEQAAAEAGSGPVSGGDNRSQTTYGDNRSQTTYAKGGKVAKVMREYKAGELHSGSKKGPKVSNPKQAIAIALSEAGKAKKAGGGMAQKVQMAKTNAIEASLKGQKKTPYAKGGYAEGGYKDEMGNPIGPREYEAIQNPPFPLKGIKNGRYTDPGTIERAKDVVRTVGNTAFSRAPAGYADMAEATVERAGRGLRKAGEYVGGKLKDLAKMEERGYKKGGMAKHEDVAMDRKLVKQMVKPAALKKAEGGVAARPLSLAVRPGARQSAPDIAKMGATMGKAMGGPAMPPLQRGAQMPMLKRPTPARPGAVPVAPAGPMIAPPQGGVGVNAKRPGGPNVGAIRAAMARAATAARPEASPAMMKKGGKTKCCWFAKITGLATSASRSTIRAAP